MLVVAVAVIACRDDVKNVVHRETNPDSVPTVVSRNVKTLISDSGVTQYRITTKLWYIYSQATKPHLFFPDGLYLEQFDKNLKTAASVQCDSATYYVDSKLWQLDGNVRIWNVNKELILTNQLFWSQRDQKVYSDSFIHIEKADRTLEGYGFVSNERMTTYTLHRPSGIFPYDESRAPGAQRETAPPDSAQ